MEAYKIVVGKNRENMLPHFISQSSEIATFKSDILPLMKKYGLIKNYPKGSLRKAHPSTVGIMCFSSRTIAENWANSCKLNSEDLEIVKVKGFGEPEDISDTPVIINMIPIYWKLLSKKHISSPGWGVATNAPKGTITFKSIRVLE